MLKAQRCTERYWICSTPVSHKGDSWQVINE